MTIWDQSKKQMKLHQKIQQSLEIFNLIQEPWRGCPDHSSVNCFLRHPHLCYKAEQRKNFHSVKFTNEFTIPIQAILTMRNQMSWVFSNALLATKRILLELWTRPALTLMISRNFKSINYDIPNFFSLKLSHYTNFYTNHFWSYRTIFVLFSLCKNICKEKSDKLFWRSKENFAYLLLI